MLDLLNNGTAARVTLLLAPAGYGKSVIAAQWREELLRRGAQVAWLTLQPVERDAMRVVVREWRLGAGDALTVRPGDQLTVDPGARVRFEAGRRVPGAPPSGMAWAAGRRGSVGY